MRLLHTADWHLGRTLEGRSREEEQEAVMSEICGIARDEQVDAVLMAGDVFDTVNPPAVSEALFYETAQRLSAGGKRPLLIIAGNHDSPDRLQASRPLAGKQGITIIGRPLAAPLQIPIRRTDELLRISCVPYPSESRLNECLTEMNEEKAIQQAYDARLRFLFSEHARSFQAGAVNLLMTHLFVAGGSESDSERPIQVGGAYTVSPDSFPQQAQYIALGHLHRPQTIGHAPVPARYAGSPLAYSFSEAGQEKSVTILEAAPGRPVKWEKIPLAAGRSLVRWKADGLDEVRRWQQENRDDGAWIDLEIKLDQALSMRDIQELRQANEHIVNIRPIYSFSDSVQTVRRSQLSLNQLFIRFYRRQTQGAEPDESLIRLFLHLIEEETADSEAAAGDDSDQAD